MARRKKTSPSRDVQQLHESRRRFLKQAAFAGIGVAVAPTLLAKSASAQAPAPPAALLPAPGPPLSWHASQSIYSGVNNLANGNVHLTHSVCGWGGKGGGLNFGLFFNSQSGQSGAAGAKWSHSFAWRIAGTSPAVVVAGDGTETSYAWNGSAYTAPVGSYDLLTHNGDGTWTLTLKGGLQYRFRTDGLLGSIVDLNGSTTSLTYSGTALTQVTDAGGRTLLLGYSSGKLASVTDFEGRVWTLSYDGSGRLSQIADPLLSGQSYHTTFGYDAGGNVASITDRLGKTWSYAYGTSNVLTQMTDHDGQISKYGAAATQPVDSPGPNSGVVAVGYYYGYYGYPRQYWWRYQVGDGSTGTPTFYEVVWPADVIAVSSIIDPAGNYVEHGHDSAGRVTAIRNNTDNRAVFAYDASNNRTSQQLDSGATWQWGYDTKGNALSHTDPLNLTTSNTYDSGSRLLTVTNPMGHLTQYGYDTRGNLASVTDPQNNVTNHVYGAWGQLTQTTDPRGYLTTYGYNSATGDQTSVTDPLGHQTSFQYANGRVTQRTDAVGRVTTYAYDAWGRQTGITYPNSSPVSLSYDAMGRLTGSTDGTGTRTYSYDSWGRKVGMTDPMGSTAASYDAVGKMLSQSDVSGRTHSYSYDSSTRLASVGDGTGTVSYTYTADGRPATALYPNGTQAAYGYDTAGRVTSLAHTKVSDNSTLVSYSAVYDNAGRLTQVTEQPSGAVTTYTYDNAGRLLSENRTGDRPYSGNYTYDAKGNRLTANTVTNGVTTHNGTYSYDNAGRLTQVVDAATSTTEVYGWNNDGTLASYPGPGYTRKLEYDEEQRLIRIKKDFGGGNIQTAYEYGYGADGGRRWKKDYAGNAWTWFPCGVACCAGELVEKQSDLTGNSWVTSAQLLQGAEPVRRNGEYSHFDIIGRAAIITDASGTVISNNVYDSIGSQKFVQGTAQTPLRVGEPLAEELIASGKAAYLPTRAVANSIHVVCPAWGCGCPIWQCGPKGGGGFEPTYQGCMTLCKFATLACRGGFVVSQLCKFVLTKGCEAYCKDIKNWKPWPDCTKLCRHSPIGQCRNCCNATCDGRIGALSPCYKMCATRPEGTDA